MFSYRTSPFFELVNSFQATGPDEVEMASDASASIIPDFAPGRARSGDPGSSGGVASGGTPGRSGRARVSGSTGATGAGATGGATGGGTGGKPAWSTGKIWKDGDDKSQKSCYVIAFWIFLDWMVFPCFPWTAAIEIQTLKFSSCFWCTIANSAAAKRCCESTSAVEGSSMILKI